MSNITVSFRELIDTVERLVAGRDNTSITLSRPQSHVAALVSAGFTTDRWSGAFADAYSRFTSGVQITVGSLDDLAGFLRTTAQTLGEVDVQLGARPGR